MPKVSAKPTVGSKTNDCKTKPHVQLIMLCRDEAAHIATAIASALPIIDSYCIADTGSKDNTREVAMEAFGDLPGKWVEHEWENFGVNRSKLFKAATKEGYLLLMDADEELVGDVSLPDKLDADQYDVFYEGSYSWAQPRVIRASLPWRFEGVAHSYLTCDKTASLDALRGFQIRHHGGGRHGLEKYKRDRILLERAYKENPTKPRTAFYLAQTYKDLGDWKNAIKFYRIRAGLSGGFVEEMFYARFQLGCLLCTHVSFLKGAQELIKAYEMRPTRAEPLRALAQSANAMANKIAYPDDRLFVHANCYVGPDLDDGWAMPRDFLEKLVKAIEKRKPKLIVEVGSGSSTVTLAAAAKEAGARIVTLEHDPLFLKRTNGMLRRYGQTAEVRLAPLEDVGSFKWYAQEAWEDLEDIDVLIVDGPPGYLGPGSRYPALPLLANRLSPGALVVLDDIQRHDECAIVDRWHDEGFIETAQRIDHSKGAAVMAQTES